MQNDKWNRQADRIFEEVVGKHVKSVEVKPDLNFDMGQQTVGRYDEHGNLYQRRRTDKHAASATVHRKIDLLRSYIDVLVLDILTHNDIHSKKLLKLSDIQEYILVRTHRLLEITVGHLSIMEISNISNIRPYLEIESIHVTNMVRSFGTNEAILSLHQLVHSDMILELTYSVLAITDISSLPDVKSCKKYLDDKKLGYDDLHSLRFGLRYGNTELMEIQKVRFYYGIYYHGMKGEIKNNEFK